MNRTECQKEHFSSQAFGPHYIYDAECCQTVCYYYLSVRVNAINNETRHYSAITVLDDIITSETV